jgi:2-amino-4-hydroxy-6-hydroxymethyldihydropteridine diphosphokinase
MTVAYIALGSNLGDRLATLRAAVRRLRAEPGLRVLDVSGWWETDPVGGPPGQGKFLNAAAAAETDKSPEELLALLQQIENQFGRVRGVKDGPRTLDLDLLLYGDRVIDTPTLTVPHPRMHERAFVLSPLSELAGEIGHEVVHPILKKTAQELYEPILANPGGPLPRLYIPPPTRTAELAGLHALVTGSTSGIGDRIALAMEQHGAEVTRHGRSQTWGGRYVAADLRDPDRCDRLVEESWGQGLDILVLNAGADTLTGEAGRWSFERKLDELIAVDLKSTIRLARAFGAKMKARGRGVILTVGWDQAETGMEGDSGQLFGAVKGAVMCFTRSLALSLAPEVRVNCLAPGWVRTAWGETASADWQDRVRRETPLGVWGLPEDVAAAACWLASPAASFVTGQTLRVNGGAVR